MRLPIHTEFNSFEKNKLQTMSEFGVGLNMVKSMRHWSQATKVCDKNFELTDFGKFVFSKKKAADPYLEKNETLWLLHWMIASDSNLNTGLFISLISVSLNFSCTSHVPFHEIISTSV